MKDRIIKFLAKAIIRQTEFLCSIDEATLDNEQRIILEKAIYGYLKTKI